jgi:hypothetical protein
MSKLYLVILSPKEKIWDSITRYSFPKKKGDSITRYGFYSLVTLIVASLGNASLPATSTALMIPTGTGHAAW